MIVEPLLLDNRGNIGRPKLAACNNLEKIVDDLIADDHADFFGPLRLQPVIHHIFVAYSAEIPFNQLLACLRIDPQCLGEYFSDDLQKRAVILSPVEKIPLGQFSVFAGPNHHRVLRLARAHNVGNGS